MPVMSCFVVLTPEQAAASNNVLGASLFPGSAYVPLKEDARLALHAAMDKTIVYGAAASQRTVWIQIEISLSEEVQLQAFQSEHLIRDKFHSGWKWFGALYLDKMTEVKVWQITVEKLTMTVWTKWALDGGWLDRRDGGKCAECSAEEISVWAPESSSSHRASLYHCANCWLQEMLRRATAL